MIGSFKIVYGYTTQKDIIYMYTCFAFSIFFKWKGRSSVDFILDMQSSKSLCKIEREHAFSFKVERTIYTI